jgi:hypothetical protein
MRGERYEEKEEGIGKKGRGEGNSAEEETWEEYFWYAETKVLDRCRAFDLFVSVDAQSLTFHSFRPKVEYLIDVEHSTHMQVSLPTTSCITGMGQSLER